MRSFDPSPRLQIRAQLVDRALQLAAAREATSAAAVVARRTSRSLAQVLRDGLGSLEHDVAVLVADNARAEARRRFDEREDPPEDEPGADALTQTYNAAVRRCYTHHEAERRRQAAESQATAREIMPR